jgi:hypothetical protein
MAIGGLCHRIGVRIGIFVWETATSQLERWLSLFGEPVKLIVQQKRHLDLSPSIIGLTPN